MTIKSLAESLGRYFNQPSQIQNVGHLNDDELNAVTKTFTQAQKEESFERAKAVASSLTIEAFIQEYINQLNQPQKKERPWSAARVLTEGRRQDQRRWEAGGFGGSSSAGPRTRAGKSREGKRNPSE